MFLRGRLQVGLFVVSLVSGILSIILAQSGIEKTVPTTVTIAATTTIPMTTTTFVEPIHYIVQPGDSLFQIASSYLLDMQALMDLNKISNQDHIEVGDELLFPPANGFVPVAPSTTMKP